MGVSLYGLRWNDRSRKLMVRNFDILTQDDHRKFTKLFLRFGDLDCDLVTRKNKNGINYALVTYRSKRDARECERNQNDLKYRRGNALVFNGRELMIGYVTLIWCIFIIFENIFCDIISRNETAFCVLP